MASSLCKCGGPDIVVTGSPTGPCEEGGCIFVPHLLVKKEASILPCTDNQLEMDLSDKIRLDPDQEPSIANLAIVDYTSNMKNVVIAADANRSNITVTFDAIQEAGNTLFGVIWYKVVQNNLSAVASITVPFKSACDGKIIAVGSSCDPCTGIITAPSDTVNLIA